MKLENCEIKRYGGTFVTAPEAAQVLHISTSHAYKIIHRLNQELKAQGFLTIAGRMSVYKDNKTNTWRVIYRYTDWTGEQKQSSRRGFASKHEAQAWEREQMNKVTADLDMTFASFVEHYTEDLKTRLKENTWSTKDHIIRTKLIPYFGKLKMCAVTPQIVMTWQNEMLRFRDKDGKPYSPVYLRTVQNQLTAIFNHAMKYYNLRENPCRKAGPLGKKKSREMLFWTKEEYLKFADAMMDKPKSFYAFELLYWCGMREGELLALTPSDFDLEKGRRQDHHAKDRKEQPYHHHAGFPDGGSGGIH